MSPALVLRRPIESFRQASSLFELHYDASLYRIAVRVFQRVNDTLTLRRFTALTLPYVYSSDSSKQNLAVAVGVLLAASLGLKDGGYTLYGDNTTSLSWSAEDRPASELYNGAVYPFLASRYQGYHPFYVR